MAPATHKEAQAHLKRRTPITADYKASSACFDNLVAVATTVSLSLQPRIVCERKGLVQQPSSIVVQRRRWAYGGGSDIHIGLPNPLSLHISSFTFCVVVPGFVPDQK